jgi:hypothetical protein
VIRSFLNFSGAQETFVERNLIPSNIQCFFRVRMIVEEN